MKSTTSKAPCAVVMVAMVLAGPMIARAARAQDGPAPGDLAPSLSLEPDGGHVLDARLTTAVWVPRLGGQSMLGASGDIFDFETNLRLNGSEPSPGVELTLRRDAFWQFRFGGFDFETADSGTFAGTASFGPVTLAPGDRWRGRVSMTSMEFEIGARLWRPYESSPERPDDADLAFVPVLGARYVSVDQVLERAGGPRVRAQGDWLTILAGIELHLRFSTDGRVPFIRAVELQTGAAAGPAIGGDGGTAWQVRGGFAFELSPSTDFYFGYRLLELDVENDDFEFDAGLQGLYVGASFRF